MPQPVVVHSTFVVERSFAKPPSEVFAAFRDPDKKRRWFAESASHDVVEYSLDFRNGGMEHGSYKLNASSPFPGAIVSYEGTFQDIVAGNRIVVAHTMSIQGRRISASLVTFEFLPTHLGTDLVCTHQGAFFEGSDGPEMREAGWNKLLDQLQAQASSVAN